MIEFDLYLIYFLLIMNKKILLASFIFPERVEWFLNYLETKFKITKDNVFCYKNLEDESKVIMTFKLSIPEDKSLNLKDLFPNAMPIHKRGSCIYTINALNKMIEILHPESIGNIDNKSIKIEWDEYQNKMIIINSSELKIFNIIKVF